jgi:hypothetical protein
MAEYSRVAKGHFTSTGNAQIVVLPFQPDAVELWNYTVANSAAASQNIASAYWDVSMGQGFGIIQGYNTTPSLIYDTVTTNGISTFSAGIALQYGAVFNNSSNAFSINKASPAQVTTTSAHGLATGNVVVFSNLAQTSTTGMQQIAGIPFMVTVTGTTTFTINYNTNQSNFTAFNTATSTNNVGSFKQVLYPNLYLPQDVIIDAITTGTTTTVSTTTAHQLQVGQEIAFRIPTVWGPTQLNSLPNNVIPGQPIYGYVVSVTNAQTFVCSINSTGFTAFNSNQTFASTAGRTFAQVTPVGDVNTGGVQISAGSQLYPSPQFTNAVYNDSNTINGPAIIGSYINNTNQGFIVGAGAGTVLTTGKLVGASSNVIYWRAYLSDYAFN